MRKTNPLSLFMLATAVAAAFVGWSGAALPERVASHFGASGVANGFMPRATYIAVMLGLVIGLPVLMVLVTWLAMGRPGARINLPNRDYWLAPERRAATLSTLRAAVLWFGILLVVFLCYAHWLVVRANASAPARLAESWFIGGLLVFVVASLAQTGILLGRFRRRGA